MDNNEFFRVILPDGFRDHSDDDPVDGLVRQPEQGLGLDRLLGVHLLRLRQALLSVEGLDGLETRVSVGGQRPLRSWHLRSGPVVSWGLGTGA